MHVAEKSVSTFQALTDKIETKTARVGIVGLGCVGLPLAVEFAKAGFHVTGTDRPAVPDDRRIQGESYVQDVPNGEVVTYRLLHCARARHHQHLCADSAAETKDPDMSHIMSAADEIAKHFHPGLLVISGVHDISRNDGELLLLTFETHGV